MSAQKRDAETGAALFAPVGDEQPSARQRRDRRGRVVARLAVGVAVGVVVLAAVLRGIDLAEVKSRLAAADRSTLAWALATVLATTVAKAGRWLALFPEGQRPPFHVASRALLAGQVANFILPVRGGDAVRAYLVQAGVRTSFVTAAATLGAEKVFDVVALLAVAGITAAIVPLPRWAATSLGAAAIVGIALAGLVAALPPPLLHQWIHRGSRRLGQRVGRAIEAIAVNALAGLEALRDRRMALTACSWSALVWALAASTNWLVLHALGLRLGIGAALLQLVLHMVPFPAHVPGRVGEHQALSLVGLAPYGVGEVSQVAFATALYAVVFLPQVVLGALSLGLSAFATGQAHDQDVGDSAGV